MKKIIQITLLFCCISLLSGCFATTHVVGAGGISDGKADYDAKRKKWFLLFGVIPLDDVNAQQLSGDAQDYTVRETFTFIDGMISAVTVGIVVPRTIRVSKGKASSYIEGEGEKKEYWSKAENSSAIQGEPDKDE